MIVTHAHAPVRNQLFADVMQDLKLPCPCDLSQYPMEIRGILENGRGHFDIRILGYAHHLFHGPHLVSIGFQSPPFWVQSLSCFKKNFFGFQDRLSFERSIFVHFSNSLIRLKNIRFIVTLPQLDLPLDTPIYRSPSLVIPSKHSYTSSASSKTATASHEPRRKTILKNCIQTLLTVYKRDFSCRMECVQALNHEFAYECSNIIQAMETEIPNSPLMEILYDDDTERVVNMTPQEWDALLQVENV